MTYAKIYNQLERAGLIEKLMVETNYDKLGIIRGIEYLENFIGSSTFNGMQYWSESTADKIICKVCTEYAKLQMENNKKYIAKFKYMAEKMGVN